MKAWFIGHDVIVLAGILAGGLLLLQHFTTDRRKQRFRLLRSAALERPAYRMLLLLVLVGVVLISTLPEAAFVLPAIDAVGLDVVTIFVALELRHYLAAGAQLVGIPTGTEVYLRIAAQVVRRCKDAFSRHPVLWLYGCMWLVIWIRVFTVGQSPPSKV
ncbi:MAG TPA: hypothetical protein VI653_23305 [Steroidobacteraceae bacterium]